MTKDELLARYDSLTSKTVYGVESIARELARREQNLQTLVLLLLTAGLFGLTAAITVLTLINVAVVAGPPVAAWVATW